MFGIELEIGGTSKCSSEFGETMANFIGTVKALQMWFQGAHHVTKGSGFAGDHSLLYSEIYDKFDDEVDVIAEKALGIGNDENAVCPRGVASRASEILQNLPSPVGQTSLGLAACGLSIMKAHLRYLDWLYDALDEAGDMTLGLDDFIMASANGHEKFVYLLQQRVKQDI
jgi:DNA-binding ferritin-like protein